MAIQHTSSKDILTYGLGIVSDFSVVDFDNLFFEPSSLELKADGAQVERLNKIGDCDIIPKNKFYGKNLQNPTDIFSVRISKNGTYTIDVEQKNDTALLYVKIEIDAGITCEIRECFKSKKYFGAIVEICVQKDAHCEYISVPQKSAQTQFIGRFVNIGRDASYALFDMNINIPLIKSSSYIELNEEGATGSIYGIFAGAAQEYFDIHHVVEHKAPQTKSTMLVKGVLDGKAQAIYQGLIKIHEGANKADGAQKEETLLLSPFARVSAVPELEIAHNDVKCSHSVSTTYLDRLKLFYFNMRGIDSATAKKELVHGHLSGVIDKISDPKLRESFYTMIGKDTIKYGN